MADDIREEDVERCLRIVLMVLEMLKRSLKYSIACSFLSFFFRIVIADMISFVEIYLFFLIRVKGTEGRRFF